ncbi:acyl-CoA dehydrogenase family protein [Actinopolymorpha sp. B17G11]|uniref:acyl-CoA dehydrogenase family protein n=1 Tax=Actinopolymorpha sp. B17G11 TaxID=3160861 RepID=UPI0032E3A7A7
MEPAEGSEDWRASPLWRAAERLARDLLAPHAAEVDASTVPRTHLDAFGKAGLLGIAAPGEDGGSDAPPALARRIQQVLAGADCATWFVSAQHHGTVRMVADSNAECRRELLPRLVTGEQIAGTAFAHLRRWPDRPVETERVSGGWRFTGDAPWFTGWGLNDVCALGGATTDGEVVFGIIDARPQPGLMASDPIRMAAMTATRTVRLRFDQLVVPDSLIVSRTPIEPWLRSDRRQTVNPNPAVFGVTEAAIRHLATRSEDADLAVGVAAARRLGERLAAAQAEADRLLDHVPPDEAHDERLAFRAEVQRLMVDATTALVVAGAGRSLTLTDPAQRLAREAAFLLVQAQTRPAREVLLRQWVS